MSGWEPVPRDLVAALAAWKPGDGPPDAAVWLWTWRQARDGAMPSIRDVAMYGQCGKTKAARIRAAVERSLETWEGPERGVCSEASGTKRDSDGTLAGQDMTTDTASPSSDGTLAGHPRDDRARDLLSTPTETLDSRSPTDSCGTAPVPRWCPPKNQMPDGVSRQDFAACVLDAIEAITGSRPKPERAKTAAKPMLSLWRALGNPPPAEWLPDVQLVALAARECPDPTFARDVRAEGWVGGKDRSRSVATLSVQQRWDERIQAARRWDAEGRPSVSSQPKHNSHSPEPRRTPLSEYVPSWAVIVADPEPEEDNVIPMGAR